MAVRRRDIDRADYDSFAFLRLFDVQLRSPAQDVGDQAAMARIQMLDDQKRRRKSDGQRTDQQTERV